MQDTVDVICPYCGQINELFIDYSGGTHQTYLEDCQVCCQPWEVHVDLTGQEPLVSITPADI